MTSGEQKTTNSESPAFQSWKGKLRKILKSESPFSELREKLQAAIAAGTISELEHADVAIKKLTDSLELVELIMACEEIGFESTLSETSTVRELSWVLKKLEIEDQRQQSD